MARAILLFCILCWGIGAKPERIPYIISFSLISSFFFTR